MFSLAGGSIHKSRVAYGCVLLLGSASVAGVAVGDNNGKWFSTIGEKIQGIFSGGGGGAGTADAQQTNGLVAAWSWVSETGKSVFDWTIKPAALAFTKIHKTYHSWWTGLKTFFGSLIKREMYTMLFEKFHTKLYNLVSFFLAGGESRKAFIDLFKEKTKRENTLKVGKFLLGVADEWKGSFRAGSNLFNYLLFSWLSDPTKVTKKFQKLSDRIAKMDEQFKTSNGTSSSSVGGGGEDKVYELNTETLKEYLEIEEGRQESWWMTFLLTEIGVKMKTGVNLGWNKKWLSQFRVFF